MNVCPICNSNEIFKVINWHLNFEIKRCKTCDILFSSPIPNEKDHYEYYQHKIFGKPNQDELRKLIKRRKKELIKLFKINKNNKNLLSQKKFLDYGGGSGTLTLAARELGFDTFYYDISEEAKDFVKKVFNIKDSHLIQTMKGSNKFDIIFSDQVIEHVTEPVNMIESLLPLLTKNGILMIKTPSARNSEAFSYPYNLFKGYILEALKYNSLRKTLSTLVNKEMRFWGCDPPRHLYSFSKKSFDYIAELLKIPKSSYYIKYYSIPTFEYVSPIVIFNKSFRIFPTIKENIKNIITFPFKFIFWTIVDFIFKIFHIIAKSSKNYGGDIILIIKKSNHT